MRLCPPSTIASKGSTTYLQDVEPDLLRECGYQSGGGGGGSSRHRRRGGGHVHGSVDVVLVLFVVVVMLVLIDVGRVYHRWRNRDWRSMIDENRSVRSITDDRWHAAGGAGGMGGVRGHGSGLGGLSGNGDQRGGNGVSRCVVVYCCECIREKKGTQGKFTPVRHADRRQSKCIKVTPPLAHIPCSPSPSAHIANDFN